MHAHALTSGDGVTYIIDNVKDVKSSPELKPTLNLHRVKGTFGSVIAETDLVNLVFKSNISANT